MALQEELDRREQEISDLRAENEDLHLTVDTLKSELVQTNEDADHVHSELEQLRLRAFDSQRQTSDEATSRETALRDAQEDLERVRMEREEWEDEAMRERVRREELTARVGTIELELAAAKTEREVLREERDREAESAANLHNVLEEFQAGQLRCSGSSARPLTLPICGVAAKERELKATLGDLQTQLRSTTESLNDFKRRASDAEVRTVAPLSVSIPLLTTRGTIRTNCKLRRTTRRSSWRSRRRSRTRRCSSGSCGTRVRDPAPFVVRITTNPMHSTAIIMNEHLTEALRRLKKDSNENSVDRCVSVAHGPPGPPS